eukprot:12070715-Alexandrium_andersonii.AAC.1
MASENRPGGVLEQTHWCTDYGAQRSERSTSLPKAACNSCRRAYPVSDGGQRSKAVFSAQLSM